MYILKIKGIDQLPDYIQIRDNNFTLIAYFSSRNAGKALESFGYGEQTALIKKMIKDLPYGKIREFQL